MKRVSQCSGVTVGYLKHFAFETKTRIISPRPTFASSADVSKTVVANKILAQV